MLLLEQCTVSAGYQITELIAYNRGVESVEFLVEKNCRIPCYVTVSIPTGGRPSIRFNWQDTLLYLIKAARLIWRGLE